MQAQHPDRVELRPRNFHSSGSPVIKSWWLLAAKASAYLAYEGLQPRRMAIVVPHLSIANCFARFTIRGMIMDISKYVNASQASKAIGCSVATVSRWADRLGFDRKYGSTLMLTQKEVAKIRDAWKKRAGNPNFVEKN